MPEIFGMATAKTMHCGGGAALRDLDWLQRLVKTPHIECGKIWGGGRALLLPAPPALSMKTETGHKEKCIEIAM